MGNGEYVEGIKIVLWVSSRFLSKDKFKRYKRTFINALKDLDFDIRLGSVIDTMKNKKTYPFAFKFYEVTRRPFSFLVGSQNCR